MSYKQTIIVRRDLNISPGKLAAQVSHASMAFLTTQMREYCELPDKCDFMPDGRQYKYNNYVKCPIFVTNECYDEWIKGSFTKVVCGAKNKYQLLKAVKIAEELSLQEGKDYFLIKDNCLTELEPEEIDENGIGRTLTCIGFKPLPDDVASLISRKYQLL